MLWGRGPQRWAVRAGAREGKLPCLCRGHVCGTVRAVPLVREGGVEVVLVVQEKVEEKALAKYGQESCGGHPGYI